MKSAKVIARPKEKKEVVIARPGKNSEVPIEVPVKNSEVPTEVKGEVVEELAAGVNKERNFQENIYEVFFNLT